MGICYSDDCNNHYDNMIAKADEQEEERWNKIASDYENIDVAFFEEAISNAPPQDYINLFKAFKSKNPVMIMDALKTLQYNYVESLNPCV